MDQDDDRRASEDARLLRQEGDSKAARRLAKRRHSARADPTPLPPLPPRRHRRRASGPDVAPAGSDDDPRERQLTRDDARVQRFEELELEVRVETWDEFAELALGSLMPKSRRSGWSSIRLCAEGLDGREVERAERVDLSRADLTKALLVRLRALSAILPLPYRGCITVTIEHAGVELASFAAAARIGAADPWSRQDEERLRRRVFGFIRAQDRIIYEQLGCMLGMFEASSSVIGSSADILYAAQGLRRPDVDRPPEKTTLDRMVELGAAAFEAMARSAGHTPASGLHAGDASARAPVVFPRAPKDVHPARDAPYGLGLGSGAALFGQIDDEDGLLDDADLERPGSGFALRREQADRVRADDVGDLDECLEEPDGPEDDEPFDVWALVDFPAPRYVNEPEDPDEG